MNLSPVPEAVAHAGLRAAKTTCLIGGRSELSPLQRDFLEAVQKHILGVAISLSDLTTISPEELADAVVDPELRRRIVWASILAGAIDGVLDTEEVAQVERFAAAMGVDMVYVRVAWNLAKRHLLAARFDIVRKALPGVRLRAVAHEEGVLAALRQFLPLAGIEQPSVVERYRRLWDFPEGTLGRAFAAYIDRNGFPLPGEPGAGPEIIVLHDCLHVLGGYGTSAAEEIELAAFQAGCQSGEPFHGLLFGLAQYHLGIRMAPVAPAQALQADPAKMIAAFARGCRVKRDMWQSFAPWEHFHRSVDELRRELGIDDPARG